MTYPHGNNRNDNRNPDPRDSRGGGSARNIDRNDPRDDPRNDPRDTRREPPRDDRRDDRSNTGGSERPRSSGGPSHPENDYRVKCVSATIGYAGTNTEQIGCRLQVTEGPFAGTSLTWYGFFTDKAEETSMKGMRALGFRGDDTNDLSSMLAGVEAIAVVIHEADRDSGEMRARVRWINGADVAMNKVMDAGELNSFAKRMRAKFARIGGGGSGAAPSTDRGGDRPPPRDDRRGPPTDDRRPPARDDRQTARDDRRPPADDRRPPARDDRDAPRGQGRLDDAPRGRGGEGDDDIPS